jgi:hypothetical protein
VFADGVSRGAGPAPLDDVPPGVLAAIDAGQLTKAIAIWRKEKKADILVAKTAVMALARARGKD